MIRPSNLLFFHPRKNTPSKDVGNVHTTGPAAENSKTISPNKRKAKRAASRRGSGSHGGGRAAYLYMKMSRLLARGFRQRKQASKKWPCGSPPALAPARPPPPPPDDAATSSSSTPELTSRVHAAADAPPPPRANGLSRPPPPPPPPPPPLPLPLRPPPPPPPLSDLPAPARPKQSIGGGEEEPAPGSTSPPRGRGSPVGSGSARFGGSRVRVRAAVREGGGRDGRCVVVLGVFKGETGGGGGFMK